jgi:tetratricopeptide (TPR) repeat protein
MYKEAISELQKAVELTGDISWMIGLLASTYAKLGLREEAEKILLALEGRSKEEYVKSINFAWIYFELKDFDKSFEFFEKALEERDPLVCFSKVAPEYDVIRPDPRFKALLEKMNLNK